MIFTNFRYVDDYFPPQQGLLPQSPYRKEDTIEVDDYFPPQQGLLHLLR